MTTVLHLHAGNLFGGVESLLVTLVGDASAPGLRHRFALTSAGRLADELAHHGAGVLPLNVARISRPWTVRRARRRLRRSLEITRPDLCMCHSAWSRAVLGSAAVAAGLPLALWVHGIPRAGHWLERWARRAPSALTLANSRYTAAATRAAFPELDPVVVYPPVSPPPRDPAARSTVRRQLGVDEATVVIVHAARMEAWKGHAVLIDAVYRLAADVSWTLWLVGGPQRSGEARYLRALERQVDRLALQDRVQFLGQRRDVQRLLAAADVYCQPNTAPEPFGIGFVEALYAGLPVVGPEVGGPAEIITAACGYTVPARDPGPVTARLDQLIGDAALRRRLGAAGPARAHELCDPGAAGHRLADLVGGVAGG